MFHIDSDAIRHLDGNDESRIAHAVLNHVNAEARLLNANARLLEAQAGHAENDLKREILPRSLEKLEQISAHPDCAKAPESIRKMLGDLWAILQGRV